jgi:hypothetical protein
MTRYMNEPGRADDEELFERIEQYLRGARTVGHLPPGIPAPDEWRAEMHADWYSFWEAKPSPDAFAEKASRLLWVAHLNDAARGLNTAEFRKLNALIDIAESAVLSWAIQRVDEEEGGGEDDEEFDDVGGGHAMPWDENPEAWARAAISTAVDTLVDLHIRVRKEGSPS